MTSQLITNDAIDEISIDVLIWCFFSKLSQWGSKLWLTFLPYCLLLLLYGYTDTIVRLFLEMHNKRKRKDIHSQSQIFIVFFFSWIIHLFTASKEKIYRIHSNVINILEELEERFQRSHGKQSLPKSKTDYCDHREKDDGTVFKKDR